MNTARLAEPLLRAYDPQTPAHFRSADKGPDDLVFTSPKGGMLRPNNFRRRVFAPAAVTIGIPDLIPHDLRDTAASLAISAGASIKAVQRMLGYASAKVTLDIYGGLFEEDLEALADRLEEKFGHAA